jgi:multiple sugar transport system ATP-binding protein
VATVRLDRVAKTYDRSGEAAVKSLSLSIDHGEFMVLLGPSGCGKSTTLRMIAGLETISDGELFIDEKPMARTPARDRDIAMVFQSYALYPHMSVYDNMAFGLKRRGVARDVLDRRVRDVADSIGLGQLLARRPHALSGGQRQRVALGRAIVRDPKVFLFDEPLSNLDASLRVSTRNEIIRLHRKLGATMIYVTHDQVEAMSMGTRIAIMNAGELAQVGAPLEVYRAPRSIFVARFLGSPPMNLLDGQLVRRGADLAVRVGEAVLQLPTLPGVVALSDGAPVAVGVRPEDLVEAADGAALSGRVAIVEALGAETLVTLALDAGGELIARTGPKCRLAPDARAAFHAPPQALHLFDPSTGLALDPP